MKEIYQSHLSEANIFASNLGKPSITRSPLVASNEGARPLLYHSDHNSANFVEKKEKNKAYKPTNRQAKTFKVLDMNAKHWMKLFGKEHIGILTLTFKENLTCMKEAQRRWNSFSRQFNKHGKFELLVKVAEPQKRGAVHYHCLVRTFGKIRGSIDWNIYESMGEAKTTSEKRKLGQQLGKSATSHLRDLWSWLRVTANNTGFGRTELMPLKKPDHIKNYIGKYLEKDMRQNALKKDGKNHNMRLITYGKNVPKVANQQFSWVFGKASIFRRKLKIYCDARGIKSKEELSEIYGKTWSFNIYKEIMYDRVLGTYKMKRFNELQNPDERNKAVYPYKGLIRSGAFSTNIQDGMMNDYLLDIENEKGRGSTLFTEQEKLKKWRAARHAKALHEKVYGD